MVSASAARARQLAPIVAGYVQGFADSRHAGVRHGPVHLFTGGNEWDAIALCGRRVKLWNFEGETEDDFCPGCIKKAHGVTVADGK